MRSFLHPQLEFIVSFAQFHFCPLALGNIRDHGKSIKKMAIGIADGSANRVRP